MLAQNNVFESRKRSHGGSSMGLTRGRLAAFVLVTLFFMGCAGIDQEGSLQQAGAHYKIGIAYMNEGKIQQAFVEFQKSYELNPRDKENLNAIGIIYLLHFDDIPKAIDHFQRAVRMDPLFSEAYNNIGFAYDRLGQFEAAIPYYQKALSNLLYPTADKAYINLGNAYYRLGKYELALTAYREAIKRAPGLSLPYYRMSLCFNAMGRYGDASAAITTAIVLDPYYKGDKDIAFDDMNRKKLKAGGYDEKDIRDYIEILKY